MIRTIIENILLFMLPTFVYVAWVLFQRSREAEADDDDRRATPPSSVLDDAPLLWLFVAGAFLVIVTLAAFGTSSGGRPGQHYQPGVLKDGRIEPGEIR
jgi:hypothetical protein